MHNNSLTCFNPPKDLFDNEAQFNVRLHNLRSCGANNFWSEQTGIQDSSQNT
jgi:hypothetical protein